MLPGSVAVSQHDQSYGPREHLLPESSQSLATLALDKSDTCFDLETFQKHLSVAFLEVAWSSSELLVFYISRITQFYRLQTKIKAVSLHAFYSPRIK